MKLLIVEDDAMLGRALETGLRQAGHAVDWLRDGRSADQALTMQVYDLVLLDLGLPRRDGLQVLRAVRGRQDTTPVLILTARDGLEERVAGLDSGADDYLVKPVALAELLARIRALARRAAGRANNLLTVGALELDLTTRQARFRKRAVDLTGREFALLEALAQRPGAIQSRAGLEEKLCAWGEELESNAVDVHIHNLRRKLDPSLIRNIRGVGWRLESLS